MLSGFVAALTLLPAVVRGLRGAERRDGAFWLLLALAVAGPWAKVLQFGAGAWSTGLSAALWITVAATMVVFLLLCLLTREAWRLTALVCAYLACVSVLALVWERAPAAAVLAVGADAWVGVHIAFSVTTYALVTLAAMAATAAFLKERALRNKRPDGISRVLPSVSDCERLLMRLLWVGEAVLACGVITGMTVQFLETGSLFALDHKSVLAVAAFLFIGGLLIAHHRVGFRGRAAARGVLVAYLLLTLAYPGVKFVTDVLLA